MGIELEAVQHVGDDRAQHGGDRYARDDALQHAQRQAKLPEPRQGRQSDQQSGRAAQQHADHEFDSQLSQDRTPRGGLSAKHLLGQADRLNAHALGQRQHDRNEQRQRRELASRSRNE